MIALVIKEKKTKKNTDKLATPASVVTAHLDFIKDLIKHGLCYEPFIGTKSYLKAMTGYVVTTELDEGTDFFEFNEVVDYIVSHPPYSILDKVLEKSVALKPKVISYLLKLSHLTPKRLGFMEQSGYYLERMKVIKIHKMGGTSVIAVWIRGEGVACISHSNIIYK